jgi:hypothetical protein
MSKPVPQPPKPPVPPPGRLVFDWVKNKDEQTKDKDKKK